MGYQTRITVKGKRRNIPAVQASIEDMLLRVVAGPHQGLELSLGRELLWIGRSEMCDLVLSDDLEVSKEHCELRLQEDGVLVRDTGSSNGLFLGDIEVREGFWEPGIPMQLGASVMELWSHQRTREIELPCADPSLRIVGRSPKMRKLFTRLSRLADRSFSVILFGETGTGKTTIAQTIHAQSLRCNGPFVVVNCGSIAPSLLEAEFFGYEKGAFTGADKRHKGYFEQADGGTLFLDELGELPLALQPKLLRVLESGRVRPLGSEQEKEVDVRLLSSTHRLLSQEVESGRFRQDLYYRLAVVECVVPPLRERLEDIPLLLEWLLRDEPEQPDLLFTERAMRRLQQHSWPGNVRELRNVLRRTLALLDPVRWQANEVTIDADDLILSDEFDEDEFDEDELGGVWLPGELSALSETPSFASLSSRSLMAVESISLPPEAPLKESVEAFERALILDALEQTQWSMAKASERLNISRVWLYKRIKKYGLKQLQPAKAEESV